MTKRDLATIVLKLIGIHILVRYLGYLPIIMSSLTVLSARSPGAVPQPFVVLLYIVPTLVYFGVCVLIVVKSEVVAAKLIPEDGEFSVGFSLSKQDVLTIAFCCVGLMILVGVIPQLVQAATGILLTERVPELSRMPQFLANAYARLAGNIAQALIGLALFLQARGMAGLWQTLRDYKGIQDRKSRE